MEVSQAQLTDPGAARALLGMLQEEISQYGKAEQGVKQNRGEAQEQLIRAARKHEEEAKECWHVLVRMQKAAASTDGPAAEQINDCFERAHQLIAGMHWN